MVSFAFPGFNKLALIMVLNVAVESKLKISISTIIVIIHGKFRSILAAFNISLGGVVGFVRPVIQPMSEGSYEIFHI